MISFGEEICSKLDFSTGREWLETNGIGGVCVRYDHGVPHAALSRAAGRSDQATRRPICVAVKAGRDSHHRRSPRRFEHKSFSGRRELVDPKVTRKSTGE